MPDDFQARWRQRWDRLKTSHVVGMMLAIFLEERSKIYQDRSIIRPRYTLGNQFPCSVSNNSPATARYCVCRLPGWACATELLFFHDPEHHASMLRDIGVCGGTNWYFKRGLCLRLERSRPRRGSAACLRPSARRAWPAACCLRRCLRCSAVPLSRAPARGPRGCTR